MKYKFMEIRPIGIGENKKRTLFKREGDGLERANTKTKPNPLGFYYYPETMNDEKAFINLKSFLINIHRKEIKRIEKSLKELTKLEFPKE